MYGATGFAVTSVGGALVEISGRWGYQRLIGVLLIGLGRSEVLMAEIS